MLLPVDAAATITHLARASKTAFAKTPMFLPMAPHLSLSHRRRLCPPPPPSLLEKESTPRERGERHFMPLPPRRGPPRQGFGASVRSVDPSTSTINSKSKSILAQRVYLVIIINIIVVPFWHGGEANSGALRNAHSRRTRRGAWGQTLILIIIVGRGGG